MNVTKVYQVLVFQQESWQKTYMYIEFNTNIRKVAMNDFEKDFYELLNNKLFEKTIENPRKDGRESTKEGWHLADL